MTRTRSLIVPMIALALAAPFVPALAAPKSGSGSSASDATPPTVMAKRGKQIFADDFERSELGKGWRAGIPKVTVQNGVMVGEELPERMHAAVAKVNMPYKDIVADFDFRFDGGKSMNFVMDDNTYKGAHAGHIARVQFSQWGVNLGDSKTGVMANEHYENKDKPEYKEKLAEVRARTEFMNRAARLEQGKWYHGTVEILGDEGVVSIDGKPVAYLRSPGLDHATKNLLGFSISGQVGLVDNLKVYEATADAGWDRRRAELKSKLAAEAAAKPAAQPRGKAATPAKGKGKTK